MREGINKIVVMLLLLNQVFVGGGVGVVLAQEATDSGVLVPTIVEESVVSTESGEEVLEELVVEEVVEEAETLVEVSVDIDSIPAVEEPVVVITPAVEAQSSAQLKQPQRVRRLARVVYRADEEVSVVVDNARASEISLKLYNSDGQEVEADVEIINEDSPAVLNVSLSETIKPGKYRLVVTDGEGQVTVQDFSWGVLAINLNKSIYAPNEVASLSMAVLDEGGMMVCDASLSLRIRKIVGWEENYEVTEEVLSTENGRIWVNKECLIKDYVERADYEAVYQLAEVGRYDLRLTAVTENGEYQIEDKIEVRESVPFDIERVGHTRLFPPVTYPMQMTIKAFEDFEGEIIETVPASFAITPLTGVVEFNEMVLEPVEVEVPEGTIFGLVPPFDGSYPISLYFGQAVVDPTIKAKYSEYGLVGHDGVDFDISTGTAILSVDDGEVVRAQMNGDYGNTVVIQHSWGRSYYGHLSEITVQVGKKIQKGHPLGLSGSSGLSTGPHLHFGIKPTINDFDNGFYGKINPLPYLYIKEGNQDVLDEVAREEESRNYVLSGLSPSGTAQIVWQVNMKAGEEIVLGYNYKVPRISPQFYLAGPLVIQDTSGQMVFAETRPWQLAIDADGSGTNIVNPTTGDTDATGRTYTFTFTAAETMDSGEFTVSIPAGWSAPQGTGGVAGYTTVVGNANATVATVWTSADSLTGWNEDDSDTCNSGSQLSLDTSIYNEGTGSIKCDNSSSSAPDKGDSFSYDVPNQDWSGYTELGVWLRVDENTGANDMRVAYDNVATCVHTGVIESFAVPGLSANTWSYQKFTMTLGRTDVDSVCFFTNDKAGFDSNIWWVDEILLGPGLPTFSGSGPWIISTRILDAANTETFTVTYGDGGGASGVTNHTTTNTYTFTTQSTPVVTGTLTSISSSPTVILSDPPSGPTMDKIMRHGAWFSAGVEQPFTF